MGAGASDSLLITVSLDSVNQVIFNPIQSRDLSRTISNWKDH